MEFHNDRISLETADTELNNMKFLQKFQTHVQ